MTGLALFWLQVELFMHVDHFCNLSQSAFLQEQAKKKDSLTFSSRMVTSPINYALFSPLSPFLQVKGTLWQCRAKRDPGVEGAYLNGIDPSSSFSCLILYLYFPNSFSC